MRLPHFTLAELLLWAAAAAVWVFLTLQLGAGVGWGGNSASYAIVPLVLTGMTFALRQLLPQKPVSWPMAALAAPLLALGILSLVAWYTSA